MHLHGEAAIETVSGEMSCFSNVGSQINILSSDIQSEEDDLQLLNYGKCCVLWYFIHCIVVPAQVCAGEA